MNPLPLWLRWILAAVLVLNGALAPLDTTQAKSSADSNGIPHAAMGPNCHHHLASQAAGMPKHVQSECPCCEGSKCQCRCISSVAVATVFPDLRPLAPQVFAARWSSREPAISPLHRLLRPPIA